MSALGEVLSGIAHELNNPLSVVVGNAHLLLEEEIDPDLRPRVERMTTAAERCVRIVRTFLSMARNRPLDMVKHSLPDLVETAREAFFSDAASDGRRGLRSIFAADLPPLVVDEVQIVQVLVNVMTNAAHAMADGGVGDEITITAKAEGREVLLRLSDNGPGVPA